MTNDRDEEFLRTKLTDGLHPAEVDLWPAVAEALPNARPAWPWRRIALCLAAPLLIAAGVLAGTAEFMTTPNRFASISTAFLMSMS